MTTTNNSGLRAFQATAAALTEGLRVKVDSAGLISAAIATEIAIGVTTEAIAASGYGNVKLFSASGTWLCVASAAITRGTQLFPAAAGKVAATGVTKLPLIALEAAGADNDLIECAPCWLGA